MNELALSVLRVVMGVGIVVGIILAVYWQSQSSLRKVHQLRQWRSTLEQNDPVLTRFMIGKYLVGLDNCDYATNYVECVVTPTDFVFAQLRGQELGRVPRDSVEEVTFDDKSQTVQRLTATRLIALGVFALAAPKKKKINEWCVVVRWIDGKGLKRTTVFEFTGSNPERGANTAANMLMKYILRRPQQPGDAARCFDYRL